MQLMSMSVLEMQSYLPTLRGDRVLLFGVRRILQPSVISLEIIVRNSSLASGRLETPVPFNGFRSCTPPNPVASMAYRHVPTTDYCTTAVRGAT